MQQSKINKRCRACAVIMYRARIYGKHSSRALPAIIRNKNAYQCLRPYG